MKKFKSISFAERGYGYFPYLIVRLRAGLYQQIPIHRSGIENPYLEGLFLEENEIENKHNYELACKKVFKTYWQEQMDAGTPKDVCLVLNRSEAYYLSPEGVCNLNSIPSGGWLYSINDELIQEDGNHFNYPL